jgi:hypothetical protein
MADNNYDTVPTGGPPGVETPETGVHASVDEERLSQ